MFLFAARLALQTLEKLSKLLLILHSVPHNHVDGCGNFIWLVNDGIVLCKSNANTFRRNSRLFDEFLTETKLPRQFPREFSRDVLFWTARTFGDIFLDGVNATRNFERKFVLCGEYSGRKFVAIVHSFKKIWLNFWLGTLSVKLPWNFPLRLSLRATYVVCNHDNTQCINCVDAIGIIYVLYFC